MVQFKANGLSFEVETHGERTGVPLVLIRGLGTQIIHWPPAMIGALKAAGFYVVTFDNRDAGLSEKLDHAGVPDIERIEKQLAEGGATDAAYSTADMANDVVALMDALGLEKAHVFGMSMGGLITQHLGLDHPGRLASATIAMSSSGAPGLPARQGDVWELVLSSPKSSAREDVIKHTLMCDRAFGSPGFPFADETRAELIGRAYDRAYHPVAVMRQYAAMIAGRGRHDQLAGVALPVLVIHGKDDPLYPAEHGRDLARRIPGSAYVEIPGMGHDLEGELATIIAGHVTKFIRNLDE